MFQSTHLSSLQTSVSVAVPRRALGWAGLVASLVLAACVAVPTAKPEDQVRSRATERWQALVSGDYLKAYTFSTEGYKAVVKADAYKQRFGAAAWSGAEVVGVNCPEVDKCTARVRIDYINVMSRKSLNKITTHIDETWLLEGGQWSIFQAI
jgi:hypothetical protein